MTDDAVVDKRTEFGIMLGKSAVTDHDRAQAILERAVAPSDAITALLSEARRDGFELQISWQVDQFGRFFPNLAVVKPLVRR